MGRTSSKNNVGPRPIGYAAASSNRFVRTNLSAALDEVAATDFEVLVASS